MVRHRITEMEPAIDLVGGLSVNFSLSNPDAKVDNPLLQPFLDMLRLTHSVEPAFVLMPTTRSSRLRCVTTSLYPNCFRASSRKKL